VKLFLGFAVANIPYFTILRFEIYRPVLCNLVCESLLSLVFICMSFVEIGKRMEYSLGSTAFSCLMFTIAIVTNISFLLFCFVMFFITGNHRELMRGALGVWPVLLGLIAVECAQAPPATTRRLFVFEIPVLIMLFFFWLFLHCSACSVCLLCCRQALVIYTALGTWTFSN